MKRTIKAIGFDIGGVIFPDLHVPVEGEMARELGVSSKLASEIFGEVWKRLAAGRTTEDELWQRLIEESKRKASLEELRNLYRTYLTPNLQMVSLLKNLSQQYTLLVVSNTAQEWFNYELDHFQLRSFFKTLVTSFEARVRKPRSEFFKFFVRKLSSLGCLPEECLFVDDREKNTRTAQEFGFQTIVFKDLFCLKTELDKRGIRL